MKTLGFASSALLVLPACSPAPSPDVAPSNGAVVAGAGKLRELMKNADVQKALTNPMTVYGCDPRPIDGSLFGVEVADGRSFGVGGDCAGRCSAHGQ